MIQFQITAPASLSIFGEHANNSLRSSIDLRTMLNFQELNRSSKSIEINFPQINLLHKIPLDEFLKFYDICVKNMEQLHSQVSLFTQAYTSNEQKFLQIFYYLLVSIMYEEQIEIRQFRIDIFINLFIKEKFFCLATLKVCLAAYLLHWAHLQNGTQNTFDDTDLKKIYAYATLCENTESENIDIMVCTYGSVIQYEKELDTCKALYLPRMKILLVDSKQTRNVETQKQNMRELMTVFPETVNSILKNIDGITNMAADTLEKIFDIYIDNELSIEMKNDHLLQKQKSLENYTRMNQRLLQMLGVSYYHLDEICAIAQKHGLAGKYAGFGDDRYAYIWYPIISNVNIDIASFINELNTHSFDVITTNLICTGVKIE